MFLKVGGSEKKMKRGEWPHKRAAQTSTHCVTFFVKNPCHNLGKIYILFSFELRKGTWKQQKFWENFGKSKIQNWCQPVIINTTTYSLCLCSVICKIMASLYTMKIALLRNRLLSLIKHHSTDSHFGSVKRYFVWHGRKVGPCTWTPERLGPPGPPENPGPLVT